MSTKEVLRINGKVLQDAKEYLGLVQQLNRCRQAFVGLEDKMTTAQIQFVNETQVLIEKAMPVVTEVTSVVQKLENLPSSAPKHKRRAVAKALDAMIVGWAADSMDIVAAILKAGSLFAESDVDATESSETDVIDGEVVNE